MAVTQITRLLPRPVLPAIWREFAGLERAASGRRGFPAPPAADSRQPVLLIPGFLVGDSSLRPLAGALRAAGHEPHAAGIRWNVGCSEEAVGRVAAAAAQLAERHDRRIAVVGHSRGGLFARVLARRHPELVSSVVTLGSPYRDQLAVHPLVWASAAALATAGTLRVPGVLRWSCGASGCCARFDRDLASPVPEDVDVLSVYSRRDGVVDWRACIEPTGRRLEVASTHCGMAAHAPTLWAVAAAIAEFAAAR
jgi:pimeloyl-ACP methyl ester carboxylesterase